MKPDNAQPVLIRTCNTWPVYNIVFSNAFSSFDKYYEYLGPFDLVDRCSYLKCRRMDDSFFYRALIGNLNESIAILLRKVRRDSNLDHNLFEKHFAVLGFSVFKPLDKRDVFSRYFPLFAKTEHINTGTCPDRCEEVIERGRGGAVSSVFWRLVGCNNESVKLGIHSLLSRKRYFDFYVSPLFMKNGF
jgi:hypothetical protein